MAFRRRKFGRKPGRKRRGFITRVGQGLTRGIRGAFPIAKQALSIASGIKSLMNVEVKVNDATISTTPDNATGSVSYCSAIGQGNDYTDRQGRSVKGVYVHWQLLLTLNGIATATSIRLILARDIQQQGTAPTIGDILQQVQTTGAIKLSAARGRWDILMDKRCVLTANGYNRKCFYSGFRKYPFHIEYKGTTSGASDAGMNALYLFALSDETTNTPSVTGIVRLRYVDN